MHDTSTGRLIGVLVSPARTFESLRERPTWVAPLVVLMVLTLALGLVVHQRTDYTMVAEKSFEARGADLPDDPDLFEQAVGQIETFSRIGVWVSPAIQVVFLLLFAAIYLALFNFVAGAELTFRQSLATLLYGSMPLAVMLLLAIPVVLGGGPVTWEQISTRSFLASNLAFLAPAGSAKLKALLAGIDFFVLWSTVLQAIGFRIVARVSAAASAGIVIFLFLVGLGLRVLFASFGGG